MTISVIIPTWNEAENIGRTIQSLNRTAGGIEIIVADGGSGDETRKAAENAGADHVLISDQPGRSRQMNAGAARACGEWLVFLHADTLLPDDGLERIANLPETVVGGAFQRRFDSDSVFLAITASISDFRSRNGGIFLGDQAIFVRRTVFDEMDGYDENFRIAEEIDFSRRLGKISGETVLLPGPAISSARRFEKTGPIRQSCRDLWLTAKFFLFPDSFKFSPRINSESAKPE